MPELYESITAIIGLSLAGFARYVVIQLNKYKVQSLNTLELSAEQVFADDIKNLRLTLKEFNPVAKQISQASKISKIDRVLILTCVNGASKPERATVMWDANDEEVWSYDDIALDTDYQLKIENIEKNPYLQFKTESAVNTKIGGFYELEGVKESIWIMIAKKVSLNTNQIGYMYMSASTHGDEEMGHEELRIAKTVATLMKNLVIPYGYRPI